MTFLTDGYQAPVGAAGLYPGFANPPPWRITLGYGVYYLLLGTSAAIHTGIDLSIEPGGGLGQPVYATANGVVTFAQDVTGQSWRKLVVIEHHDPDGTARCSRYGHLQRIDVKIGQWVIRGQPIGTLGNGEGLFYPHLHFDIARGLILVTNPTHWPGNQPSVVTATYYDPKEVIEDIPAMNDTIQQVEDLLAQSIELLKTVEAPPEPLPGTEMVTTANLNVRTAPVNGTIVATLLLGDIVRVVDASPSPWKQIVYGPYTSRYVSGAFLVPKV